MIFSHVLYQLSYPATHAGRQPRYLVPYSGLKAGATGLEPATSDVTGRRSNQLNYTPAKRLRDYRMSGSPGKCHLADASGRSRI
jgi:hypothetical protein